MEIIVLLLLRFARTILKTSYYYILMVHVGGNKTKGWSYWFGDIGEERERG